MKLRVIPIVVIVLALVAGIIIKLSYEGASKDSPPDEPVVYTSNQGQTLDEKCDVLRKHASFHPITPIEDAAYKITVYTGGWGPSSSTSLIAILVKPKYLQQWLQGYERIDDDSQTAWEFKSLSLPWTVKSPPKFYRNEFGHELILHQAEGVVLIYDID